MRSYSETNVFSSSEVEALQRATRLVVAIPTRIGGPLLRCHEVARVVGRILDLDVQDGHYGAVEHSWVYTENARSILDVYAVGRLPMVQLVDARALLPTGRAYYPGPTRDDIDETAVRELVQFLRRRL